MTIEKWHVYRANLDPVVGSEQGKSRPVLVVSEDFLNELLNCVNIVPLTTQRSGRKIYPNEVLIPANIAGLPNDSIALCHQIRTIDKRRLSLNYSAIADESLQNEILDAICFQLGIDH